MLLERSTVYALLAALCFGAGWKVNGWRLGEGIAQDKAEAVTAVRVIERAQQTVADTEGDKGHAELEQARSAAADAADTARGVRAEAGRLATRLSTCNAGTASERKARAAAAAVFADVLNDVEAQGRAMAEVADRARAAGGACERTYDGVKAVRK
jgi:hypothetical protein